MDFLTNLINHWETLVGAFVVFVGALITLARVVVALTPTKKDDEALTKFEKFWTALAFKKPRITTVEETDPTVKN